MVFFYILLKSINGKNFLKIKITVILIWNLQNALLSESMTQLIFPSWKLKFKRNALSIKPLFLQRKLKKNCKTKYYAWISLNRHYTGKICRVNLKFSGFYNQIHIYLYINQPHINKLFSNLKLYSSIISSNHTLVGMRTDPKFGE